jgi:hypothetical protein
MNPIGCYSAARRRVERKLTESQRRLYKAMAKEWTEKKPPLVEQQRYVHGK